MLCSVAVLRDKDSEKSSKIQFSNWAEKVVEVNWAKKTLSIPILECLLDLDGYLYMIGISIRGYHNPLTPPRKQIVRLPCVLVYNDPLLSHLLGAASHLLSLWCKQLSKQYEPPFFTTQRSQAGFHFSTTPPNITSSLFLSHDMVVNLQKKTVINTF